MHRLGISRVTEITRMDRLGLPVFVSVRPRGAALCVHAGKGVFPIEAEVGALMEAIEFAVAEPHRSRSDRRRLTVAEVDAQLGNELRFVDLVPRNAVRVRAAQRVDAVECEELRSGRRVWLPAERVFVPYPTGRLPSLFGTSTTGLASGNTLEEATLHGLLEVLERDAIAMSLPGNASARIDNDELPEPFATLAARWEMAGVHLAVRWVPNEFGLPCFEALMHEAGSTDVNLALGSGLHVDREVALARAVCEAAQSRLSLIHGGRDDIPSYFDKYREGAGASALRAAERQTLDGGFSTHVRARYQDIARAPAPSSSLAQMLAGVLEVLSARGFPTVYRHRFAVDLVGSLEVVKVIVPRCEDTDAGMSRIGRRLWTELVRHARATS
jgi:ribosomal protein S12 methylthiotransferase accessory factor